MSDINTSEEKKGLQNGFKKLLSNIGAVIEDAASLEVATFAGDFTYKAHQVIKNGTDKVSINNVLKNMTVENQTNLQLVAYSNIKIDSDVSTIVKSDLSDSDAELMKLHASMMESGKQSRQAVIEMAKNLVKTI